MYIYISTLNNNAHTRESAGHNKVTSSSVAGWVRKLRCREDCHNHTLNNAHGLNRTVCPLLCLCSPHTPGCPAVTKRLSLLVGCFTSQQQASVSQGRICLDKFMCCHTEIEVADQTFYLTQSQYTDTGPTSPSADPIKPDAWQDSHWSANF